MFLSTQMKYSLKQVHRLSLRSSSTTTKHPHIPHNMHISLPNWTPEFTDAVIKMRRLHKHGPTPLRSNINDMRKSTDKSRVPEQMYHKQAIIESGDHLGSNPDLPSYDWVYNKKYINSSSFLSTNSPSGLKFVLYLHGGGFSLYSKEAYRHVLTRLAVETDTIILAINYKRSPEYEYPIPEIDCMKAYEWMIKNIASPKHSIHVIGDSAGGALAIGSMCRARDAKLPLPCGIVSISPWVDVFNNTHESMVKYRDIDYLMIDHLEPLGDLYSSTHDPQCSVVRRDLRGLPPILLEYGECEIFAGQIKDFIRAAHTQGVKAIDKEYSGMPHVFQLFHFTEQPECIESNKNLAKFIETTRYDMIKK